MNQKFSLGRSGVVGGVALGMVCLAVIVFSPKDISGTAHASQPINIKYFKGIESIRLALYGLPQDQL